jgi:hypothetical protein
VNNVCYVQEWSCLDTHRHTLVVSLSLNAVGVAAVLCTKEVENALH